MYTIGGEIYHHGIQGQKWGKRNGPPYPLKPGAKSAAETKGKKAKAEQGGLISYIKRKRKQKKLNKQIKRVEKDIKVLDKEKKKYEEWETKKKELLQFDEDTSAAAKRILKNLSKMSDNEIKQTLNRMRDVEDLKKYVKKDPTKFELMKKKMDVMMDNVDWLQKKVRVGIDAWNTMARIVNTFDDEEEPTMKIIKSDFNTKKPSQFQQNNQNPQQQPQNKKQRDRR